MLEKTVDNWINLSFAQINQWCINVINYTQGIKNLENITIHFTSNGLLLFYAVISILFVAFTNQLKTFSPNSELRPLPFTYRQAINLLTLSKFLILALFLYWFLINTMYYYKWTYQYNFKNYQIYLYNFLFLTAETTLIILMTVTRIHKIPIFKAFIDRKVIKKLNKISTNYQMKNTGRKLHNADGIKRKTIDYDVKKYIKKNSLFHGLNEIKKPVYTDFLQSFDGHFTIIGGSGMGKGVLTRMYLYQTIKNNITNIIFDPKPDEFMFNACVDFAKQNNKEIHVVDLDKPIPQISLFKDISSSQFRDILTSALELQKLKNSSARIWAGRTEMALHNIAQNIFKENITPAEIKQAFAYFPELIKDSEDTLNLFTFLDDYQIFNTKTGLNLKKIIESKDVLYIRCSKAKTNDISRQQAQILFTTLFEHINTRNHQTATQCVVVVDEFKFIMNTAIMDNLATIRSQKCSLIFNFQDISNFTTSPNESLRNPNYANELLSNSHVIAVHNASDMTLIKLIQNKCGKTTYDKSYENDTSNAGGSSQTSHERKWTTHDEFKLTENKIASGEKRTAILLSSLLSNGNFERIHTDIIKTTPHQFKINTEAKPIIIKSTQSIKTNTASAAHEYKNQNQQSEQKNNDDNFNGFVEV